MSSPTNQRLNYFYQQFLQESDFTQEQQYHMDMRRWHNASLHTWGVVYGLDLQDTKQGDKEVTISSGGAIDSTGREIILPERTPTSGLATHQGTVYITIAYAEKQTDPQPAALAGAATINDSSTRMTETPSIGIANEIPADGGLTLVLGTIKVNSSGVVAAAPTPEDAYQHVTYAGVKSGSITTSMLTIEDAHNVNIKSSLTLAAGTTSSLQITGDLSVTGDIGLDGGFAPASAEQGLRILRCRVTISNPKVTAAQKLTPPSMDITATYKGKGQVLIGLKGFSVADEPSFFVTPITSDNPHFATVSVSNPESKGFQGLVNIYQALATPTLDDSDFALLIVGLKAQEQG